MFSGQVITPDMAEYDERRQVWNSAIDKRPTAIVVCHSVTDVASAVMYANELNLPICIRGGGHHVAGMAVADDALMIDMSEMRTVIVHPYLNQVQVSAGARLGDVDRETQKHGLAVPTGTVSKTGIAGLTLNGGLGYLRRKFGLTCDNLIGALVVTAKGEVVEVNETQHPELLWALRGGGGNFGVVVRFDYRLYPVGPEVFAIDVMYDYSDARLILQKVREYMHTAPDEVTFNVSVIQLPAEPFLPEELHNRKVIVLAGMYYGDEDEAFNVTRPIREFALPIMDHTGMRTYVALQSKDDPMVPETVPAAGTSLYFDDLTDDVIDRFIRNVDVIPSPVLLAQLWPLGGQMNRVSSSDTAFAIRDAGYGLFLDVMAVGTSIEACQEWNDNAYSDMLPVSHKQASYLNAIPAGGDVAKWTFADNYERLREIKQKWDPDNRFCFNHNIK